MKKTITITEFIKIKGSQEKAAHKIGITFATLNRWLNGHFRPSSLARKKMEEIGIKFDLDKENKRSRILSPHRK
ncbi:MAG: helix-turn-helix transcriptional regulator [Elusimicrobia bacterium]|nr:helix-turn-helix transcriptional regulator [Candidatus Obscuribacterium magneticum]